MTKVKPFTGTQDEIEKRYVRHMLKPMTMTLQIFGMFIPRHRKGFARFFQWVYSLLIISILWINTVRTAILFQLSNGRSESLTTTAALFIIFIASSYGSTVFLFVSTRKLDRILDAFDEYRSQHEFAFKPERVRKILLSACVSFPMSILVSSVWISFILARYETGFIRYLYPFDPTTHLFVGIAVLAIQTVLACTLGGLAILPFGFFCYSVTKEFSSLNTQFKSGVFSNFEALRIHHRDICRLLDQSNTIVRHIVFTILGAAIPTICLLIFGLIVGSLPFWDMLIIISFALVYILLAFSLSIAGAILNLEAHGCLDTLMDIKLEELPEKTLHVISIFTTRLTGPPIGFHVYGLFTIDTSTILTIFGSLVTYAVVMVQFTP